MPLYSLPEKVELGKELIAEAIHINSQRAKQPFVKVNFGGISQSLFESEMFGHKKELLRMLPPPVSDAFEMANKGTIFWTRSVISTLRVR